MAEKGEGRAVFSDNGSDLAKRIGAYAAVAILTFAVDALILKALILFAGFGPYIGRLISLPVALFVNWLLNRSVVFQSPPKADIAEVARYAAARLFSASMNYAIYSSILLLADLFGPIDPAIAVAAATIVMMTPNFLIMRHFVFRPR